MIVPGDITPTNQEFRKELTQIYNVNDVNELVAKDRNGNRYYIFTITPAAKRDYAKAYGYDSVGAADSEK